MTLQEHCQAGEAKLNQVSTALLDPRPEILEACEIQLQEVIELLESAASGSSAGVSADRENLLSLRHRMMTGSAPTGSSTPPICARAGFRLA